MLPHKRELHEPYIAITGWNKIASVSNFASSQANVAVTTGTWYYEVTLLTSGVQQASLLQPTGATRPGTAAALRPNAVRRLAGALQTPSSTGRWVSAMCQARPRVGVAVARGKEP
jgi:hypothetical protein